MVATLGTAAAASAVIVAGPLLGAAVAAVVVLLAALAAYVAITRPLAKRLSALARQAQELGNADVDLKPDPRRDGLGRVSRRLADAHQRALEHERLLRTQYQALRYQQVNIAHDLRTPLTTLLLALENAREEALLGRDCRQPLQAAIAEAVYLESLVQNFRIASRMDAGFATLGERGELDLVQVVKRVVTRFELLSKGTGTAIEFAHPDDPVCVVGDATMIEQMVTNLMQNSLSYGGNEQQIALVLHTRGRRFVLDVLDEGPGIDSAVMDTITERWVRGGTGEHRSKSGHGLGLAIVSEVAAVHNWKLDLRNREEGGLCARIKGAIVVHGEAMPSGQLSG